MGAERGADDGGDAVLVGGMAVDPAGGSLTLLDELVVYNCE
jgi:hypothetical protein